ncbi:MAG TPA: TonB-dependent siderophore receptor [Nitrospirales bacterium]|nr:TonB-dependent siderophore receptor [Nitrospirales bacterium]
MRSDNQSIVEPYLRQHANRSHPKTWLGRVLVVMLLIVMHLSPAMVQAVLAETGPTQIVNFDIPSQPVGSALNAFADATGWQISLPTELAAGLTSPGVIGSYTPEVALQTLLSGTGLTYQLADTNAVILVQQSSTGAVPSALPSQRPVVSRESPPSSSKATPKTVKVPEIVVKEVRERDDAKTYVAEESHTATRTDTPIRDVPQSIQVITRKVIEEQRTYRLQNTLENISGINATESTASLYDSLIIRGFAATDRSYYRNGLLDPFAQFMASDTYNIRRIEVLKGPASVLYGQGDPGGIINLVTNKALPNAEYSASTTLGNYNFYRSDLNATGPLNKNKTLLYRLNVAGQKANSFIDYANRDLVAVAPSLTWLIGSRTSFTVDFDYMRRWTNDPYGLPAQGTYLPNPNGPISRKTSTTLGSFSTFNRSSYRVGYDLSHQFNDKWSVRNAYRYSIVEDDKDNLYAGFDSLDPDQRTIQRFQVLQPVVARRHAHSMVTNVVGHLQFLNMEHTLLTGVELRQEKTDQFTFAFGEAPPLDLYNPDYSLRPNPFDGPRISNVGDTKSVGVYMQDQVTILPNLKFLGGVRYDYVDQYQKFTFAGDSTKDSLDNDAWSPRLGLVYQPIEPVSLYTSWTKGFQPSSASSVNPDGESFKPERSTQYEVGIKAFLLDNRISATLAWFHLTRKNLLTPDSNPAQAAQGFMVQTGEQRSQGVEFDVTAQLTAGWNVIAGYAYTDAEVTKDNDPTLEHKRLANVPYNKFTLWSTYHFQEGVLKGFGVGGGIFAYTDRNATIFENMPTMPGYVRADAALYYNRELPPGNWLGAKGVNAALNFRNLLDQRYVATSYNGSSSFFFGEPLTVLGTLGIRF